jgi:hypothetical protein
MKQWARQADCSCQPALHARVGTGCQQACMAGAATFAVAGSYALHSFIVVIKPRTYILHCGWLHCLRVACFVVSWMMHASVRVWVHHQPATFTTSWASRIIVSGRAACLHMMIHICSHLQTSCTKWLVHVTVLCAMTLGEWIWTKRRQDWRNVQMACNRHDATGKHKKWNVCHLFSSSATSL